MAESSLKDKTVKGVGWSSIDSVINYGISFIVGIILARLLSPNEYGLIGVITIFINISETIVDSGFTTALIRRNDIDNKDYCTVFYTNLVLSILMALCLCLGAPALAHYFNRVELIDLTRVMSIILIINALGLVQKTKLSKNIDFKTQAKVSIIAHVVSGTVGISLALTGLGVWALVGQQLSNQILTTVSYWFFNKWVPSLIFSWDSFKKLFNFSWKLLTAQIINTLWNELYKFIIGKNYKPATLGLYTRAQQFCGIFSSNISTVVQRVSLPALSTIKDEKERFVQAYRRVIKVTMFVTLVSMFSFAAVSESFIYVLLGRQWIECVPFIQILSFNLMLYPLQILNVNMMTIQGRSDLILMLQIIKNIISLIPLLLGIYVGIYWMLIGSVFVAWSHYFLNSYFSGKELEYSSLKQLKDILPSFCVALIIAVPMWLLSFMEISYYVMLPIQLFVGICMAYFSVKVIRLPEYVELRGIVMVYISKLTKKK